MMIEQTAILDVGYVDRKGTSHTSVTFGRRLHGRDVFEAERASNLSAENSALLYRAAAIKFGELDFITVQAFLSLDKLDLERVDVAYNRFMQESLEGRAAEFIDDCTVRVPFGIVREGETYNTATFGYLTTGHDEVAAERAGFGSIGTTCFLLAREITKFSTSDGSKSLDTPLPMSLFEEMDIADILALKEASDNWQESLRDARANARLRESEQQDLVN